MREARQILIIRIRSSSTTILRLKADTVAGEIDERGLLIARSEAGRCRMVCFSPRHDLTLARMSVSDVRKVVDTLAQEFSTLAADPCIRSVQICENRGAMMGCSNPHPHGQIWANETLPNELEKELRASRDYRQQHKTTLLQDYLELELKKQERLVCANDHFVLLVPFWAVWPFESMLISRRPMSALDELRDEELPHWPRYFAKARFVTTIYLEHRFPTQWDFISGRRMVGTIPSFISMLISIHRYCARRR